MLDDNTGLRGPSGYKHSVESVASHVHVLNQYRIAIEANSPGPHPLNRPVANGDVKKRSRSVANSYAVAESPTLTRSATGTVSNAENCEPVKIDSDVIRDDHDHVGVLVLGD